MAVQGPSAFPQNLDTDPLCPQSYSQVLSSGPSAPKWGTIYRAAQQHVRATLGRNKSLGRRQACMFGPGRPSPAALFMTTAERSLEWSGDTDSAKPGGAGWGGSQKGPRDTER